MKRQLYFLLIFSIGFVTTVMSQQGSSGFLFDDFRDAAIYFTNGSSASGKVNYNVTEKELYYIDNSDGMVKIIADKENIRIIKFDDRSFIREKGGLQEVLPTNPSIYIEYFPKVKTKASDVGYGMKSDISSTSAYSYLGQRGYLIPESQKQETYGFNHRYWIDKDGDKKQFVTFKQLLKMYPKYKTELEDIIKTKSIDFNDVEGVVNLCLYAEGLK